MAIWRVPLGLLIIVASLAGAAYEGLRLRVESSVRLLEASATRLITRDDHPRARILARSELERVNKMIRWVPNDADLHMIAAVHYRTLSRSGEAIRAYERAFEVNSRPEILLNLAVTHIEDGDPSQAVVIFAEMFRFDREYFYYTPPGPITDAALKLAGTGAVAASRQ